jgi:hypothetical protein
VRSVAICESLYFVNNTVKPVGVESFAIFAEKTFGKLGSIITELYSVRNVWQHLKCKLKVTRIRGDSSEEGDGVWEPMETDLHFLTDQASMTNEVLLTTTPVALACGSENS